MKKYLLTTVALVLIGFGRTYAQQEPQFTHFMFNKLVYNPAAAGENPDFVTITGLIHDQWTDFKSPEGEVAPKTQTASIDARLYRSKDLNGQQDGKWYLAGGFHFLNDREAFIGTTGFMASIAYGKFLNNVLGGINVSAGINLGMVNKSLTPTWKPVDHNDPLLPGTISNSGFDAGIGLYAYGAKWWAGLSALHLPGAQINWATPNDPTWHGTNTYDLTQTYYLTAGYRIEFPASPDFSVDPSILVKKDIARTSFGAAGLLYWKRMFYAGLSVRTENVTATAVMVGFNYLFPDGKQALRLGYSYDVATQIPTVFGGTHEILLSYQFKVNIGTIPRVFDRTQRWL
jgi:type IX secretion system PorP/SprF family membrane protein